jgi:hypothetical protein
MLPHTETTGCPRCGARFSESDEATIPVNTDQFPWDAVVHNPMPFRLLSATITEALFHPSHFYRNVVDHSRKLFPAWIYAMIAGGIGLTSSWIWSYWTFHNRSTGLFGSIFSGGDGVPASTLVFAPLLVSAVVLFSAVYISIFLRLSRLKRCSFSQLLRVLCYTETPMLLQIVPVIGPLLAFIVWVYSLLTALRILYEGSRVKILFHLMLPFVLLATLLLIILLSGILGGIIARAGALPDWRSLLDIL